MSGLKQQIEKKALERLEETIKNRHNTNIVEWRAKHPKEPMTMFERCACDLENQFRKVEVEFDAFKKQNVCIPTKQLEEKIITLGQLRAGNIDRIWDAGHAYGLLQLLGKAPTFKTRKEYFDWAEKNICRFLTSKESKKELLEDSKKKEQP